MKRSDVLPLPQLLLSQFVAKLSVARRLSPGGNFAEFPFWPTSASPHVISTSFEIILIRSLSKAHFSQFERTITLKDLESVWILLKGKQAGRKSKIFRLLPQSGFLRQVFKKSCPETFWALSKGNSGRQESRGYSASSQRFFCLSPFCELVS